MNQRYNIRGNKICEIREAKGIKNKLGIYLIFRDGVFRD
jgi:hypothetical protein